MRGGGARDVGLRSLAHPPTAAWSASVACGLVVGMVAQNVRVGWHTALDKLLHPHAAIDWLPWLVVVAAAISFLAAYAPRNSGSAGSSRSLASSRSPSPSACSPATSPP